MIVSSPDVFVVFAVEGSTLISSANADWHCELSEQEMFDYDIEEANTLLETAGYRFTPESPDIRVATAGSWAVQEGLVEEGVKLTFDLTYRRNAPENLKIVEYLRSEWSKVGIEAKLRVSIYSALCPVWYEYEIMIWDLKCDPDPHTQLFMQSKAAWDVSNDNFYYSPDFDAHFNGSITSLDEDVRKEHVLECQRIHYNDSALIILAEVNGTFAFRTDVFQGWGDWCEHPGRSIDNYWGASPLYFDLEPVSTSEGDGTILVVVTALSVMTIAAVTILALRRRK